MGWAPDGVKEAREAAGRRREDAVCAVLAEALRLSAYPDYATAEEAASRMLGALVRAGYKVSANRSGRVAM